MKMSGRQICNKTSDEYAFYSKIKKYAKRRANRLARRKLNKVFG